MWTNCRTSHSLVYSPLAKHQVDDSGDLSRYIAGNVSLSSIRAVAVEHNDPPGHLSATPVNESEIPEKDRIPRVTSAIWHHPYLLQSDYRKYKSGAIGSLTHSLLLHGQKYETQFSVFADGYSFRLVDLYTKPQLFVRYPPVRKLLMVELLMMTTRSFMSGMMIRTWIRLRHLWAR